MKSVSLPSNQIGQIISKNISDLDTVFVFPTDTVLNSWIDWALTNIEKTGVEAISLEQFIAWDNFKSIYLKAERNNFTAIPSILRKMFAYDIIARNAEKPQNERLRSVINSEDKYAENADSFAGWLCKNLPALDFWNKRLISNKIDYGELDFEDKDYLYIYEEYKKFLHDNNMFEPSWIEDVKLSDKSKKFLLFYPELLEDIQDYKDIFSDCDNITLYTLPKDIPSPLSYEYPDSRKELRHTILRIIDIAQSGKADWSEIALNIPDLETYRPYIEREFSIYEVPYVIKAGSPLTKNCAGRIFREIYNCFSENFTFDSVRTLLLDHCVPWKEEYQSLRENLIREGKNMRCICSPEEKDIWHVAFGSKIARLEIALKNENDNQLKNQLQTEIEYYKNMQNFYGHIKASVESFFDSKANTFENILRAWMSFKTQFLKSDEEFSDESNNILSRCIKELEEIIEIEKKYKACNLKISSPFNFYLELLDEKTYTPQTKKTGVNIFKYKLTAAAYFKYQFVIDASQKNLEVPYKRLTFLNSTKRKKLKLTDDDKILSADESFIKLYAKDTQTCDRNFVHFSSATEAFSGFSIPHSALSSVNLSKTDISKIKDLANLDENDYVLEEYDIISSDKERKIKLTEGQKRSFQSWINAQKDSDTETETAQTASYADIEKCSEKLKQLIKLRHDKDTGLLRVSARGDLEQFFPCPRHWLFKSVLKLREDTLDTNLMQNYDIGNLNHTIMEMFMKKYEKKQLPFFCESDSKFYKIPTVEDSNTINAQPVDCTDEIKNLIYHEITPKAIKAKSDFRDSPLAIITLESQKDSISSVIENFLCKLLLQTPKGIGNCTVKAVEDSFYANKKDFIYYGKIDCVLQSPEKKFVIIDYKNTAASIPTKKSLLPDENGILNDFQMPLYYQLITDDNKNEVEASIFYAIKTGDSRAMESYPTETLDQYAQTFVKKVKTEDLIPLHSGILQDRLNVKPYENCIKCSYNTICRTTFTTGKKDIKKSTGNIDSGDVK